MMESVRHNHGDRGRSLTQKRIFYLLIALTFLLLQFENGAPIMLKIEVDNNDEPFSQEITKTSRPVKVRKRNIITKTRLPVKVTANNIIMKSYSWDTSPVVIESHKLVFFTVPKVACTVWKQLFRRMMGYSDWKNATAHNPKINGLTYLSKYSVEEATYIMNSPNYTRAIFVRDPKERFLSAFLEKALNKNGSYVVKKKCCKSKPNCWEQSRSFAGFFNITKTCRDPHWEPLSSKMENKYWDTLDVVAHMETAASDARKLLQRIGAWEEYGRTGWGKYGNESFFASKQSIGHATGALSKLTSYYTPELEELVDTRYTNDYEMKQLGLIKKLIARGDGMELP